MTGEDAFERVISGPLSLRREGVPAKLHLVALRCPIIDDNSEFLAAASALLQGQGVEVVGTAKNGAEGLAKAVALQPDVILVDVYLGDESGLGLARQLNGSGGAGGPVVILISTCEEEDLGEPVEASGATGFLPKARLSAPAIRTFLSPTAR